LKVLVADDVAENRALILNIVAGEGWQTFSATTGREALAVCAANRPDLILMDTRMPEMDGLDAIRQLRGGPDGALWKIITVSASAYEEDRLQALQAGANDFVAKPVHSEELLLKARRLLGIGGPEPATVAKVVHSPAGPQATVNLARVGRLPADLRRQLHDVIIYGDYEQVFKLLEQVRALDPILAARLTRMANELDSAGLLRLLEPPK